MAVDALAAAIERRGRMRDIPDALAGNVFVTLGRQRYVRDRDNGTRIDSVGLAFRRRVEAAGCKRPGLGFYALRHAFRTVADETRDFPAVDLVMGHAAADVAGAPFAVRTCLHGSLQLSQMNLPSCQATCQGVTASRGWRTALFPI